MLYYDVSELFDNNKTNPSKEWNICHYWCFLDKGVKFEPNISNRYHNVLIISINLSDIVFLNVSGVDYCCIIFGISEKEATNLTQNIDLN